MEGKCLMVFNTNEREGKNLSWKNLLKNFEYEKRKDAQLGWEFLKTLPIYRKSDGRGGR